MIAALRDIANQRFLGFETSNAMTGRGGGQGRNTSSYGQRTKSSRGPTRKKNATSFKDTIMLFAAVFVLVGMMFYIPFLLFSRGKLLSTGRREKFSMEDFEDEFE